jgi:3-isopropylmalate/(R)-2-methylmalate dehydratase large subunit
MAEKTLYNKVIKTHTIQELAKGRVQVFIDRHLIHEVTSPPAFGNLRKSGLTSIPYPELQTATIDHVAATLFDDKAKAFTKGLRMEDALEKNCKDFGIELFDKKSGKQGIVHIIGPELGLTQPGTIMVCGDSHTSTHGAFGNISYGIGTTQVEQVLRSQSLGHNILKVRKINVIGKLSPGVDAKDLALHQISTMGVSAGIGFAHEWSGPVIDGFSMEQRMTVANLGAEGQAAASYMNPDDKTIEWLRGRERAPSGEAFDRAVAYWLSFASEADAVYDDEVTIDASKVKPTVTWGINPGQAVAIDELIPTLEQLPESQRDAAQKAYDYTGFKPGDSMEGKKIDVVFVGSCTNGRVSDLQKAANLLEGKKVAEGVTVLIVPGSAQVKEQAEKLGLDKIFTDAGAEWRGAGCSMCLGMNTDRMDEDVLIAATSNRNFRNRQGDGAKTVLMSPEMAAYAALKGKISDVREVY